MIFPAAARKSCGAVTKLAEGSSGLYGRKGRLLRHIGAGHESRAPLPQEGAPGTSRGSPRGKSAPTARSQLKTGAPGGARAAGQGCAKNPFPIVFPCHRVVRSDGTLGGFGGGLKLKRALLEMEGVQIRFNGEGEAGIHPSIKGLGYREGSGVEDPVPAKEESNFL